MENVLNYTLKMYYFNKINKCLLALFIIPERSFPTHRQFILGHNDGKEGRGSLFRVLAAFARYNPEVSYCQGRYIISKVLHMSVSDHTMLSLN